MRNPSTPVFIAKRASGGRSFRGADEYDSSKPSSALLATNLEGKSPRERAREIARLRASVKLTRAVDHWSLSLDPRLGRLAEDQWRSAAAVFLEDMGYTGCPFLVTRHSDEPQDHVHILALRIRVSDLHVVSDSHDFKRSHVAAAKCAEALGLSRLPPREDAATKPPPTDSQVRAARRARGRGTPAPKPEGMAQALRSALRRATTLEELIEAALEEGLELQAVRRDREGQGEVQGLKVRPSNAVEWTKASALGRDLSWPAARVQLERQAELRERAQAHASEVNERARSRLAARLAARDKELQLQEEKRMASDNQPPQPEANASRVTPADDLLSFLDARSQPEHARPIPAEHQATAAVAAPAIPEAEDAEQERSAQALAASNELDFEMRQLSSKQLVHLRSEDRATRLDRALLAAELVARLMILAVRVLSLGTVQLSNPLEAERRARALLAQRASDELERRRRDRSDLAVHSRAVKEHMAALGHRRLHVQARRTAAALSLGMPNVRGTRMISEADFDRERQKHGLPTIIHARAHLVQMEGSLASLIADAPRGIDRLRMSMVAGHRRQVAQAKEARERAAAALLALMDALQAEQRRRAEEGADELARAKALDERELVAIANEERAIEVEGRDQAREAERVRLAQVMRPLHDDLGQDGDQRLRDVPRPRP